MEKERSKTARVDKNTKQKNTYNLFLPYFICALSSTFYIYDFIIRVIPGTIASDLMLYYHIDATKLGLLSSLFFVGYTLMQIPCGLLYDLYGPRRLMSLTIFIAAIATFFFIATNIFAIASISSFFMGLGAAFAYIGPLILVSRWLPKRHYVLVIGLIQLMGSLGAIFGEAPLAKLVNDFGSYNILTSLALLGVLLGISYWIFIQDYPPTSKYRLSKPKMKIATPFKYVIRKPQNWAIGLYGFAIWAPISIFGSLWAVPFFMTLYASSATFAASLVSALWVGVGLGGPVFGWFTSYTQSRCLPLIVGASIGLASSLVMIYVPNLSVTIMIILLVLFGVACSAQAVTFGLIRDNNSQRYAGMAAGFNNMAIVLGGTFLQPVVGALLDWKSHSETYLYTYTIGDFRVALIILPISFLLSLFTVLFLIRETNCKFVAKKSLE